MHNNWQEISERHCTCVVRLAQTRAPYLKTNKETNFEFEQLSGTPSATVLPKYQAMQDRTSSSHTACIG